jgi:hypothetical protein
MAAANRAVLDQLLANAPPATIRQRFFPFVKYKKACELIKVFLDFF